jgi:hypothetical protein
VTRTRNLRFRRPTLENPNSDDDKDLEQSQTGAYKPAYKNNPEAAQNQAQNLSDDLVEIVMVWPELPEHIKAAIKALVHSSLIV